LKGILSARYLAMKEIETKNEDEGKEESKNHFQWLNDLRHVLWEDVKIKIRDLKTWLEFAAFIVVVAYTIVSYRQWETAKDTLAASERAWVGVDTTPQVAFSVWDQRKYQATISSVIKNFGKGPALKVKATHQLVAQGHVEEGIQWACDANFPFVGLKPSVPVVSSDESFYKRWAHVMFTGQQASPSSIVEGNTSDLIGKEAFVVGCIVYKDQFDRAHWTKFCYNTGPLVTQAVKNPSSFSHLEACNTNNSTDDEAEK
jgi:hypothetical protein